MARWHEADIHIADPDRFVIGDGLARLRPVASLHDRQSLGGCEHGAMAAARMVGVAVSHPGAVFGLRRVDPSVGRTHVNPFGMRLDPGTQARHSDVYRS